MMIGPFRGRARLAQTLDLLHRCYPIRRCPRGAATRPCVRLERGDCLAPCTSDPRIVEQHDALVMGIVDWLAGRPTEGFADPTERAEELVCTLSRERRYEEAQRVREATDHLLGVKRSYQSLDEAACLRFAALWPTAGEDGSAALRVNLVWDGRLCDAVSIPGARIAEGIADYLNGLWATRSAPRRWGMGMRAVAQKELDALLAIRRWYNEGGTASVVVLPECDAAIEERERAKQCLLAQAWQVLGLRPADRAVDSVF
jgi:excinuclease UvrABC nuclease subunit